MRLEIRGVERLSHRERQVVALKELGQTTDQIVARLSISASTVATLYNRAKQKGYQVVLVIDGDPLGVFDTNPEGEEKHESRAGPA
ncbi:MAG: sigma factor-like helix-turn-helix DNA-binding protein [Bacillota bacterium]